MDQHILELEARQSINTQEVKIGKVKPFLEEQETLKIFLAKL
jgi:hypothetical protein